MALFKSKKDKQKDTAAKVKEQMTPPSRVTGSGVPMKDKAAYISQQIKRQKPVREADLMSKTEYVAKQRSKAGLPSAEEIKSKLKKKKAK
jgi:hypothetical protein